MQCDEFETVVHDLGKFAALDRHTREAALAHARLCSRCAALTEAVGALEMSLAALAREDAQAGAPESVETALRKAFHALHPRVLKSRRTGVWAWGLAAAAALGLAAVGWYEWKVLPQSHPGAGVVQQQRTAQPAAEGTVESASSTTADESGFLPLPYSTPPGGDEEAEVVRVRMARGALSAFGLPVNAEQADEMIVVDFLVGDDGTPQAVRLSD